jgi:hypothetical protein
MKNKRSHHVSPRILSTVTIRRVEYNCSITVLNYAENCNYHLKWNMSELKRLLSRRVRFSSHVASLESWTCHQMLRTRGMRGFTGWSQGFPNMAKIFRCIRSVQENVSKTTFRINYRNTISQRQVRRGRWESVWNPLISYCLADGGDCDGISSGTFCQRDFKKYDRSHNPLVVSFAQTLYTVYHLCPRSYLRLDVTEQAAYDRLHRHDIWGQMRNSYTISKMLVKRIIFKHLFLLVHRATENWAPCSGNRNRKQGWGRRWGWGGGGVIN